jgi:hypothetical protein
VRLFFNLGLGVTYTMFFFRLGLRFPTLNENPSYVFLFWELRGLSSNFCIHMSMSDLYIPRIVPHISCSRIGRSIVEYINRSQTHACGDVAAQFLFWEYLFSNFWYWFFAVQSVSLPLPDELYGEGEGQFRCELLLGIDDEELPVVVVSHPAHI